MTDISLQETATTAKKRWRSTVCEGAVGNPGGRPRGSMNRSTRAAQLLLDGKATALSRKAVADAVGRGGITPAESFALSQMIESFLPAIDASDFDNRFGSWRTRSQHAVQILMGMRPAKPSRLECRRASGGSWRTWELRLSHTPDTPENSKPRAGLPLLLRPAAAL